LHSPGSRRRIDGKSRKPVAPAIGDEYQAIFALVSVCTFVSERRTSAFADTIAAPAACFFTFVRSFFRSAAPESCRRIDGEGRKPENIVSSLANITLFGRGESLHLGAATGHARLRHLQAPACRRLFLHFFESALFRSVAPDSCRRSDGKGRKPLLFHNSDGGSCQRLV